ncbi:MAG: DUF308 domain-containing protein [Candidatus Thorarchaeota archaeon]
MSQDMSDSDFPNWIRAVDVIVGIISIIAAILFVIGNSLSSLILIFVLSAALAAVGFARVARAAAVKAKGTPRRIVNLISGASVIIIVAALILTTGMADALQIRLIAFAWLINAIARILIGILEKDVDRKLRMLQFIVGILSAVVAVYIDLNPAVDVSTAVLFLALVVGANGLARTARGYVGV